MVILEHNSLIGEEEWVVGKVQTAFLAAGEYVL